MAKSHKPQAVQNEIVARTLARQSKSQIARDMSIHRATVRNVLKVSKIDQLLMDSRAYCAREVVPDAIESMHAQIKERDSSGDGDLSLRFLEKVGVLAGESGAPTYTIEGDVQLQQTINALLPPLSAPSVTPNPRLNGNGTDAAPLAGANNSSLTALTVEAEPVPTAAQPKRAAHQLDCGCEDCRCSECGRRRNPRDAAGRVELFDRCVCVPRSALATQR